ncbi:Uma2 family endonuclease [Limnoraphis robusta]|uniref:Uma2 family endonuclease n=1 Tax=Limnoraphis robusta CCNP1315 TaxID=3110306 RepID=A0ABU5U4J4_9CYAN|nr:Uma2 family endonuclease [Limnoraphis robusta]MEA5521038.1 Uma2 family endonuclease [Limnoraphis robusta CCNP1315]MEA5543517.1 Uma2 family endonuclease [Limnoraphis robusta CCNP1324]
MTKMTVKDVEKIQSILSEADLDYQLELEEGKITIIGPSDIVSSEVSLEFASQLSNWVKPRRLGRVFDSAGGFILPNSDLKAPDVSFVLRDRLPRSIRYFASLVPDLIVEVKSQSDRLKKLRDKIQIYIKQGVQVAIIIDPDTYQVEVYQPDQPVIVLGNGDILTVPELLPEWELVIEELWPVVFDED